MSPLRLGLTDNDNYHEFPFRHIIIPFREEACIPKPFASADLIRVCQRASESILVIRQKVRVMFRDVTLALI